MMKDEVEASVSTTMPTMKNLLTLIGHHAFSQMCNVRSVHSPLYHRPRSRYPRGPFHSGMTVTGRGKAECFAAKRLSIPAISMPNSRRSYLSSKTTSMVQMIQS